MLVQKKKSELPVWGDMFGNFFSNDWLNFPQNFNASQGTFPAVNVKDTEKSFEIEMAVPGKKKEDFKIDLNERVLSVSTESREEKEEKDERYTRREFHYSSFSRSFRLPEIADGESCTASYSDGILKISVPKKDAKTPGVKTIAIS